jgi:hypothetical protein
MRGTDNRTPDFMDELLAVITLVGGGRRPRMLVWCEIGSRLLRKRPKIDGLVDQRPQTFEGLVGSMPLMSSADSCSTIASFSSACWSQIRMYMIWSGVTSFLAISLARARRLTVLLFGTPPLAHGAS